MCHGLGFVALMQGLLPECDIDQPSLYTVRPVNDKPSALGVTSRVLVPARGVLCGGNRRQ